MDQIKKALIELNKLEKTRHYMGGYWIFLVTGKETDGQFALIEINLRKGLEPPRHKHTYEDETFYIQEGQIHFFTNTEQYLLNQGDFLHIPKGVPHHFKLVTDTAKMLCHLAPAGLEDFFIELSKPADKVDFPPLPAGPPSAEVLERIKVLQEKYGIIGMNIEDIKSI